MTDDSSHISRRTVLRSTAAVSAGTAVASRAAAETVGIDSDDPSTIKTTHQRDDAVITRYQPTDDTGIWDVEADVEENVLYTSQRIGNSVGRFDREGESFDKFFQAPTELGGPHVTALYDPSEWLGPEDTPPGVGVEDLPKSVWYTAGEGGKVGQLVLGSEGYAGTRRGPNFLEYTPPAHGGTAERRDRSPHSLAIHEGRVWFTDSGMESVGVIDPQTGLLTEKLGVPAEAIEMVVDEQRGLEHAWVMGGNVITVIDVETFETEHQVTVEQGTTGGEFTLHNAYHDPDRNRVWVLLRSADSNVVLEFVASEPEAGPQKVIEPYTPGAGLDHIHMGSFVWWSESLTNHLTRMDPDTRKVTGYRTPGSAGYFNPHNVQVVEEWNEVWFTEREALLKLEFTDDKSP